MSLVIPAVLPTSKSDLEEKLAHITPISTISRVQIDVVDGRFAKPASWPYSAKATHTPSETSRGTAQGAPYSELEMMVQKCEMLPNLHQIVYEVDLMCLDAERAAEQWLALGVSRLTFHVESLINPSRFFASVHKQYGSGLVSFGVAINVATDIMSLKPILPYIEYVQCMGIGTIGRQGQIFDKNVLDKVKRFREWHPEIPVQVDGGVSLANARELVSLGVTNLIIGSALLRALDMDAEIAKFEMMQTPFGI